MNLRNVMEAFINDGAGEYVHSANPAFRRPSISSFEFDSPPRAIHADIVIEITG